MGESVSRRPPRPKAEIGFWQLVAGLLGMAFLWEDRRCCLAVDRNEKIIHLFKHFAYSMQPTFLDVRDLIKKF